MFLEKGISNWKPGLIDSTPHQFDAHYPEEIAYQMGFIDAAQLEKLCQKYKKSGYGEYLLRLLKMGY
jgi:dTDP-glucose pyrophosphorylase